jgi:hypothetical protein
MFGYTIEKSTGNKIQYWNLRDKPADTDKYEYVECSYDDKPDLYKPSAVVRYNADTMISWALANILSQLHNTTAEEKAVSALAVTAFIDFANKANETSKSNFKAIADSIGMGKISDTIIAKAIELGAKLEK